MELRISEEPIDQLDEHGKIPIAFRVERILSVPTPASGLGGTRFSGTAVENDWVKDYDAIKAEGPTRWPKCFDISHWALIAAYDGPDRVGGAVIAFNTDGIFMLEGRSDIAVLWDLRLKPEYRASGIGSALFRAVETWCSHRACILLKVETQNINLPACRLYARMGCTLASIDTRAYDELPDESQLIWFKDLPPVIH